MSDHLLVGELITLGALNNVVKDQHGTVVGAFVSLRMQGFALPLTVDI